MLGVGTAVFGVFFFVTLFVQDVWGYSALRTGVAFLPLTAAMLAASGRPPRSCRGSAHVRCCWRRRRRRRGSVLAVPDDRARHLRGRTARPDPAPPGRARPADRPAATGRPGRASPRRTPGAASLLNVGRQAGGSIGLAVLGTVAWTVVAGSARGRPPRRRTGTRWRPASTGPSWSPPRSRCSPSCRDHHDPPPPR